MDKEPKLSDALEQVEALNEEGGQYLKLFLEMTGDYDVPPFDTNPELGMNCFKNGLEDDVNELLGLFTQNEDEDYKAELAQALRNVREMMSERPFSLFALKALFDQCIPHEEETGDKYIKKEKHYYLPNIELNRTEIEKFYIACGFTKAERSGNGDHQKWNDSKGKFVATSYNAYEIWVKNIIKQLVEKGVPLEDIEKGCTKCNIPFRIISQ